MVRADHAVKTLASTGEQLSREVAVQHSIRRIRRTKHIVPLEEIEEEGSRRKKKKATRVTLLMYTLMMIPCLYIFVLHIIHIGCAHHCISIGLTTNTVFVSISNIVAMTLVCTNCSPEKRLQFGCH